MTENDMVLAVASRLREAELRVALEVPFMCQSIDLVYEERSSELIAVEFKKHDWSRAIQQSRTHLLGADQVYICLPFREPSAQLQNGLAEAGIGLLLFDPSLPDQLVVHTEAKRNEGFLNYPRVWLQEAFEQRYVQGDWDGNDTSETSTSLWHE